MSNVKGQGSEWGVTAHDKPSACYFATTKQSQLSPGTCLLSYEVIAGLHLTLMRHHLNNWEILEIGYYKLVSEELKGINVEKRLTGFGL